MNESKSQLITEYLAGREIKRSIIRREMKIRKLLKEKYNIGTPEIWEIQDKEDKINKVIK